MDEFLSPTPNEPTEIVPRQIDEVLDAANDATGGNKLQAALVMQWLNFRLRSEDDARDLSTTLGNGHTAQLRDRVDAARSERCYYKLGDNTGKSVVRCDVGLGFTIHHPVVVAKSPTGALSFVQGNRMHRGLRVWHARFSKSKGTCYYYSNRSSTFSLWS